MSEILLVAGDPSGDAHGAKLIEALRSEIPGLRVAAIGGPLTRKAADEFLEDLASRGVSGFLEPIFHLAFFRGLLARIKARLAKGGVSAVIVIDYYGFNRRVLSLASAAGIPAYYYVSPQVWASRPGRVSVIKRLVRRAFVIFPFEEKIYKDAGVPCDFIGHPLLDVVPRGAAAKDVSSPLKVALLPGSRATELRRHLPVFLDAFDALRRYFPAAEASVFAAPSLPEEAYALALARGARIIREADYHERSRMDIALCSSGTATLENALLGLPMVVVYRLSWPTYLIARALIRVRYIAMANILADKPLVPELIQGRANKDEIAQAAKEILENPKKYQDVRAELMALRGALGGPGGASRAARTIARDLSAGRIPAEAAG